MPDNDSQHNDANDESVEVHPPRKQATHHVLSVRDGTSLGPTANAERSNLKRHSQFLQSTAFSNKRNGPPVRLIIGHPSARPNGAFRQMDFDAYYEASYDRVRRAMTLAFRDPDFAEEITQEAFFQTLRRWKRNLTTRSPRGWTMIVALNKGRDDHRRRVGKQRSTNSWLGPRQLTERGTGRRANYGHRTPRRPRRPPTKHYCCATFLSSLFPRSPR